MTGLDEILLPLKLYIQPDNTLKPIDPVKCYDDVKAAIEALVRREVLAAIRATWSYTGEGYNGEYDGLTHVGGKRYTDDEVMERVAADVLHELERLAALQAGDGGRDEQAS